MKDESLPVTEQFGLFIHDYYNLNKPFQKTCWDLKEEIQSAVLRDAKRIYIDFKAIEDFDNKNGTGLGKTLLFLRGDELDSALKFFEKEINSIDRITKAHMLGSFNDTNLTKEGFETIQKENWLKFGIKKLPDVLKIGDILEEKYQTRLIQVEGVIQNIGIPFRFARKKTFNCEKCDFEMTKHYDINERKPLNKFYCPNCGAERMFEENKEREIILKTQLITLVEGVATTSSMPISLLVVLFEDLLDDPDPEKRKFMAGSRIKAVGILKEMKSASPVKKLYLEALSWEVEAEDVFFADSDVENFKKTSQDKHLIEKLVQSYAPSIYGYEEVKEGLILQILGGVTKISEKDKKLKRGNIHVLLVGDPALAKSSLVLFNYNYLPKCKYAVCSPSSMTGAGLGVAMLRDKDTDSWYLASGVLVSASGSQAILDELDKADPEDIKSLDVVMSMCKLPVDKAGISIKLKAETSVLGVANPKGSRFDPYVNLREQVTLNDVTLSRFDVRFAFSDRPNETIDGRIADRIINPDEADTPFTSEFLFKYLLFAKKTEPQLTKKTSDKLKKFYIEMRSKNQGESNALLITARQLEGLVRLSEAYAKLRLRDKTNEDDAIRAINLFKKQLRTFGFNPETGELDIDKAEGRKSAQDRKETRELSEIYKELTAMFGDKVPMLDFIEACEKEGIKNAKKKIGQAIREGIFIEPKPDFISKA